ncbi:MAG: hypothetical protein SGBAC_013308, partial [Bacillariaceae sp.]
MSAHTTQSVKHTPQCQSNTADTDSIVKRSMHEVSNDGESQHPRRRRQHTAIGAAPSSPTKQLSMARQRQRERSERLRKERQRDNLLMLATIVMFVMVVAFSVVLYFVWKSQQTGLGWTAIVDKEMDLASPNEKPPAPSRRQSRPQSSLEFRNAEKEMMVRWQKELETLDQAIVGDKISKGGIQLNPDLLLFRNGTVNERHWKGKATHKDHQTDAPFFKRSRIFDSFPWEQDEDMSNRKMHPDDGGADSYTGEPYLDYTNPSLYHIPKFRTMEKNEQGYPRLSTLQDIFKEWPQDEIDHPPTPIQETLQHFDFSNVNELQEAWRYVDSQLPFKLINVPELLEANLKWTDAYVAEQFSKRMALGNCQESPTSFFPFYDRRKWKVSTMGIPPTRDNDFGFRRWAKHARYADQERLSSRRPHFYWQAGVPKEERYQPKDTWSFLSLDLPSFSATEPNTTLLCPDPAQSKGIQCRFGERGVTAANHYDGGQNM